MWRTSGARFNCQRRMRYRNTLSAFTISILSVYLIAIGVFQKIYDISNSNPALDKHLTFIAIVGAVFIIVLSLIEWAGDFSVKAERLFENANKIKELRSKLDRLSTKGLSEKVLTSQFDKIAENYDQLTNGVTPNHDPIDDLLFRAQNPSEPQTAFQLTKPQRIWTYVRWYWTCYWIYTIALLSPIVTLKTLTTC